MPGLPETTAYLGLGGNIGDPRGAMASALQALDRAGGINVSAVSSIYRTPPWGKVDQPDFLNCVARVETALATRALLDLCLSSERALKRVRAERWGPRVIDIDVLIHGDNVVDEDGLQVPHPRMKERAFVLAPLAELAPDLDLDGRTVSARLAALDQTGIDRLAGGTDWWLETYAV